MIYRITLTALAALLWSGCATAPPSKSTANIDLLLKGAADQKRIPGAVALVASEDKVAYQAAVGMSADTIFAIASMTKPITSVAVMQLVGAGKVKLDAPASAYAPELENVQVLEGGKLRPPNLAILSSPQVGFS